MTKRKLPFQRPECPLFDEYGNVLSEQQLLDYLKDAARGDPANHDLTNHRAGQTVVLITYLSAIVEAQQESIHKLMYRQQPNYVLVDRTAPVERHPINPSRTPADPVVTGLEDIPPAPTPEPVRCAQCGEVIHEGVRAEIYGSERIHPGCLAAWEAEHTPVPEPFRGKQPRPTCVQCGQEISGEYAKWNDETLHPECVEAFNELPF